MAELDMGAIYIDVLRRLNQGFTVRGTSAIGIIQAPTTVISFRTQAGAERFTFWESAVGTPNGIALNTTSGLFFMMSTTTALAPAAVLGAMYFDTTLNKLRVAGAGPAWETVTSA